MNATSLSFLIVATVGILVLPRRWAPVPLLASCCYMTVGQGLDIGPISLPIYRLVLAIGLLRVFARGERIVGGLNTIDKLVLTWAAWLVFASFFHERLPGSGPIYTSGFVFNVVLVYFLVRVWCGDLAELVGMLRVVAWLLVPVALAMINEHIREVNVFAVFGGVPEEVLVRDGEIRAQGPFQHPILAGTVGAVCFPLLVGIWREHRISSVVGLAASVTMVWASTSSGPLMSLLLGLAALLLWGRRNWLPVLRWAVVGAYLSAQVLMTRPAYYLISKFDLTGSSTGWYRSRLIESAIEHLSEWWLFGTDYTRHWMPVPLNSRHSDITNYYIEIGVIGGLLAMILLIAILWRAFVYVGAALRSKSAALSERQFMIWCLGAGLFAHATTSLSVAYFDQSMMFFWLNVGVISSLFALVTSDTKEATSRVIDPRDREGVAGPVLSRPRMLERPNGNPHAFKRR
jgi:hypothetical protein